MGDQSSDTKVQAAYPVSKLVATTLQRDGDLPSTPASEARSISAARIKATGARSPIKKPPFALPIHAARKIATASTRDAASRSRLFNSVLR